VPAFDVTIGHYTLVPNPFWGGALFPLVVFGFLWAFPSLERRFSGDVGFHNLLDRPRDAPWRTAIGAALFTWVALIFLAGSADRVFVTFFVSYGWQLLLFRIGVWVVPLVVLIVTRRVCLELQASERVERERALAEAEARRAAAVEPVR
jgi:ubiquinol-cytochrome c reductase cytochrome b subunit